MEIVNQQSVSTNPLTTVSPRRVNTDVRYWLSMYNGNGKSTKRFD